MIVVIVGPTGVGKTKLSLMLAKKYKAIVVNADACQIYKELNIGTAKIKEEEKENIPHVLFDIKYPNEDYSVADYQLDLRKVLEKHKDQNIIIVGGTGLYLSAGLYDYHFSKMNDLDLSNYTNEELYEMCKKIDKNILIDKNNRRRLENYLKKDEKEQPKPKLLYNNVYFIGLTTDRNILYNIIDKRVDKMIDDGLCKEVEDLYQKYGKSRILMSAIGYKEIISYLDGNITLEDAINLIKKNSRHYAKRQYTWFNNKMDITWFNVDFKDFNKTFEEISKFIAEKNES